MPVIDPLALARGIHFAATLLAAGTVSFIVLVAVPCVGAGESTALLRRLTLVVWAALAGTVLSGLVWLVLVAANILDIPLADAWLGFWPVLSGTRFGEIASLRLGFAVALGVLIALPRQRALQLAAAAALVGLLAFTGHGGATPGAAGWFHLASDLLHLFAAAAWLGGLPAFVLMLAATGTNFGPADGAVAEAATARFSVMGIVSVGVLLVSGLINSGELLGGPADLLTTAYGRVLSFKVGLFAAMVAVAAVNRFRLTPRLPAGTAIRALRRNGLIEIALGLGVLMVVGSLGTMVPGGHVHRNAAAPPSEAAFVHIHTEAVMADVTIDPGHAGKSVATIRLWREDSSAYHARGAILVLEPRDGDLPAIERKTVSQPDGTWQADAIDIPRRGVWNLRLTITPDTGSPVILDAPIVITQCSNECW